MNNITVTSCVRITRSMHIFTSASQPDPPENCHLTVKNGQKLDIFSKKNCQNFHFFRKKMTIFGNFFVIRTVPGSRQSPSYVFCKQSPAEKTRHLVFVYPNLTIKFDHKPLLKVLREYRD